MGTNWALCLWFDIQEIENSTWDIIQTILVAELKEQLTLIFVSTEIFNGHYTRETRHIASLGGVEGWHIQSETDHHHKVSILHSQEQKNFSLELKL